MSTFVITAVSTMPLEIAVIALFFIIFFINKTEKNTFLVIKSIIFVAQKVVRYHWKGNRITYVMITINHHH